jgi:hypothetical protein
MKRAIAAISAASVARGLGNAASFAGGGELGHTSS